MGTFVIPKVPILRLINKRLHFGVPRLLSILQN